MGDGAITVLKTSENKLRQFWQTEGSVQADRPIGQFRKTVLSDRR